jgi:DNA-directed RNA polymerase alpha subunit
MKKEIVNFIGSASYQGDDLGTYIWANRPDGTRDIIAVVYGYQTEIEETEGIKQAEHFQDELGNFIALAINDKIEKDNLLISKINENIKFSNFNLSVRLLNCLKVMEIDYPKDLRKIKRSEIKSARSFGRISQDELDIFMKKNGIKFLEE